MGMNVAYACNEAYIVHTAVSMISLFENNIDVGQIAVYFIDMGISQKSQEELRSIAKKYHREFVILPFSEWEKDLPVETTGRHIKSVYAKIFFGRLKEIERILYIDSDTVIAGSIQALWDTEMGTCAVAGVETINTMKARKRIGLSKDDLVINDGIILMNLRLWRKYGFEEKCMDFIRKWNGVPPVLSEGTINAICKGYIHKLGLRYNLTSASIDFSAKEIEKMTGSGYYTQEEVHLAVKNPCIIHYVTGFHDRPWNENSTHPFKEEYLKYRRLSQWADVRLCRNQMNRKIRFVYYLHRFLPENVFLLLYKVFGKSY